jgi:hypothetical protein
MSNKKVEAVKTIRAGTAKKPETVKPGETVSLPTEEADRLIGLGLAREPGKGACVQPTANEPQPPSAAEIEEALIEQIYPKLEKEELAPDNVPNIDMLVGKLGAVFKAYVPLTATVRDKSWKAFVEKNPDLFKAE